MPIEQIYPDLLEQEDLTFRVYTMDDADELSLAVGSSYEALRQWFPWAKPILSVGEAEGLCEKFEHDFRALWKGERAPDTAHVPMLTTVLTTTKRMQNCAADRGTCL